MSAIEVSSVSSCPRNTIEKTPVYTGEKFCSGIAQAISSPL
jgi:hypothetical protein